MAEAKDWIFLFPIITAVLMVIAFFLPIMYLSVYYPVFIDPAIEGPVLPFGRGIIEELEPYTSLVPEASDLQTIFLWVGIGFAIFYGLDVLFLLISAIRVKTGSKELKKAKRKWLREGIIMIIAQVIVIIVMSTVVPDAAADVDPLLELGFTIGLGMILTIVGGGILIFAYIIAKIAGASSS
ncbi:MAG: hypothetical protein ACFFA6_01705 [Promethearchaeota archaeon]